MIRYWITDCTPKMPPAEALSRIHVETLAGRPHAHGRDRDGQAWLRAQS